MHISNRVLLHNINIRIMAHKVQTKDWDNFNIDLYAQRVKRTDCRLHTYRIQYNVYKSDKQMQNTILAIDYVVAYSRDEAIRTWGKWKGLIKKITRVEPWKK